MTTPNKDQYIPTGDWAQTVTILDGQTESSAIDLAGMRLVGVILPSGFDGTTLGVKAADTLGGTYYTVADGTAAVSLTVAASQAVGFKDQIPTMFPWRFIKLVAGTAQTGDVDITLALTVM